jgi:hypothetical protein
MFLSNPAKSFCALSLLLIVFAGCRFWQDNSNTNVRPVSNSHFPFSTKEPENFQAEIVVISNGSERKMRLARKGEKRLTDYNFDDENQKSFLQADKDYLISNRKRIYSEVLPGQQATASETAQSDLTSQLLNLKNYATFEELGRENNLLKYRARLNESVATEIIVYVDEAVGIPVKQEFFSINGEQRILQYTVEMRNFKLEADENLFKIPTGFKKVTIEEFHKNISND